jgi:hypothetical protein
MPPAKQDLLRSVWRRPRPTAQDDDPADHGTAFGLDLSLDAIGPTATQDAVETTAPAPTRSSAEVGDSSPRWWPPLPVMKKGR